MNWLVAEDEADIRMLITTMIQVWGHSAAAFENGQKVWDWLDKVEAGESIAPALALMDIRMPGKKGNELAARMRTLPAFAHTPIILMTAYSMTDAERQEIIERDGVDKIIQKPLPEFDQMRQLLHNAIEARKAEAPVLTSPSPSPVTGEGKQSVGSTLTPPSPEALVLTPVAPPPLPGEGEKSVAPGNSTPAPEPAAAPRPIEPEKASEPKPS